MRAVSGDYAFIPVLKAPSNQPTRACSVPPNQASKIDYHSHAFNDSETSREVVSLRHCTRILSDP